MCMCMTLDRPTTHLLCQIFLVMCKLLPVLTERLCFKVQHCTLCFQHLDIILEKSVFSLNFITLLLQLVQFALCQYIESFEGAVSSWCGCMQYVR